MKKNANHQISVVQFNPEPLLAVGEGDNAYREKILTLIRNVIDNCPTQLRDAKRAWEEERPEDALRLFHSMRGVLGNLGMKQFSTMSLEIEKAIKNAQADLVKSLFLDITHCTETLASEANAWLAQHEISNANKYGK